MELDEARTVMQHQDTSDLPVALEALATVLRYHGIASPQLLPIAQMIEEVVDEMRGTPPAGAGALPRSHITTPMPPVRPPKGSQ